jgi:hypothetical protein
VYTTWAANNIESVSDWAELCEPAITFQIATHAAAL